jgi:hypothetical protein
MSSKKKLALLSPALAVGMALVIAPAHADSITLNFGDLVNAQPINSWFTGTQANPFFNFANPANGPQFGPSDGVVFSSNAVELRSGVSGRAPSGGSGKFENNPGGVNSFTNRAGVLFFSPSGTTASYLNDAAGFTALSFDYSYLNNNTNLGALTVEVFSGLAGTGTLLASLPLSPASTTVACTTAGDEFCTWQLASTMLPGVGESVLFGAASTTSPLSGLEFDDVPLTPTPLPATLPLFAGGFGMIGFLLRRKKQNARAAV